VGTKVLIPVEEYLHTSYSPDCDYVDGELMERNEGEFDHADLQTEIASYLRARYRKEGFVAVVEQRVQVSATRFRVPDVWRDACAAADGADFPRAALGGNRDLSPEDRFSAIQVRVDDYLAFGVPNIWVVDPKGPTSLRLQPSGVAGIHGPHPPHHRRGHHPSAA